MSLKITKVNLPQSMYSIKCPHPMNPEGVSVHETGNIASAMAEISYMQGNNRLVSYHFAVDDYRVVQGLPLDRNGWHAGDGANGRGNRRTIAVEHCYNWNGRTTTENDPVNNPKYQKAINNGVELIANLFIQYPKWGPPESGKNMWQHFDHNRKNCPQRLRQERRWNEFVGRVLKRYNELKGIKTDQDRKVEVIVSGNLYRVQVGAFSNRENAERLAAELKAKGYPVHIPDSKEVTVKEAPKPASKPKPQKSIDQLAREVLDGKWGAGDERRRSLGSQFDAVQRRVNELLRPTPRRSVKDMADEIERLGIRGNAARAKHLGLSLKEYEPVRQELNRRYK